MDESVNIGNLSKVQYLSEHEKYRCGYCGLSDSNYSHGMWAYVLTVEDYQALIDRGWRRSGKYVYKPTMDLTCCPQYTVRCEAKQFKIRDSHKKVIKKFNNFINTGVKCARDKMEVVVGSQPQHNEFRQPSTVLDLSDKIAGDKNTDGLTHSNLVSSSPSVSAVTPASSGDAEASLSTGTKMEEEKKAKSLPKPGVGLDPSKPTCRKGKLVRHEKWLKKQAALGKSQNVSKKESGPISIGDRLNKISDNPVHKFEMRLVRSNPRSQLFNETFDESYAVYKKYQMLIHNDPPEKPTEKQFSRFLVDSPLEVRLVRSSPCSEEFLRTKHESYLVYKKYQMSIHKDKPEDCDERSYNEFLVNSPLVAKCGEGSPTSGYGSFHQHYLLDGKIIAVGVIDILPKCVSSVYLYYDPDYSFLSLGTYSALREVSFIQELSALQPSIDYYYMGFYIHTCPKMKYKGQYTPSYLLCPETYKWSPMEKCSSILDTVKYSRFEESSSEEDESEANLDNLICVYSRYPLRYSSVEPILAPSCKSKVREYSTLVGLECAQRMVLILE